MDIDAMTEAFVRLKDSSPNIEDEDWSESDTRSKFIDTVLKDCLGWEEQDIIRELSRDGSRFDYRLSTTRPIMIVEAKRASKSFSINTKNKPYHIKIKTLLKGNVGLSEDISQVQEYCKTWSVPIAVLTNGCSYIIFLAVRTDGIPIDEGDAIIISNIFNDNFNYSDIANLLARSIVADGQLFSQLIGSRPAIIPKSVASMYAEQDSIKGANPIGLALQPLLEHVFTDVTKDDSIDVLDNCYVPPGSSVLRNEDFEALLLDKPPSFASSANVISVATLNSYEKFQENLKGYLVRHREGQTLIVIGRVGVGKTMFLVRYFTRPSEKKDPIKNATVPFFVDFRKPGLNPAQIPDLIFTRLRELIEALDGKLVSGGRRSVEYDFLSADGLKQVFQSEIAKLRKGFDKRLLKGDRLALVKEEQKLIDKLSESNQLFVKGAIRVLREKYHRYVCVILDNADQCNPEYQKAVYLFSRTLEEMLECLIIVALREEWYWYFGFGQKDGPFSAYHDTIYHIPAPRTRDVIAKRLEYSIELAKRHEFPSVEIEMPGNLILRASHLEKYLKVCHHAFFKDEEITVFYECLSNGNVRKGLKAFLEFLRSGHTYSEEYLKAFVTRDDYRLQFHRVFKSIAHGQYKNYIYKHSLIPNIFRPVHDAGYNHISYFARLYLLHYLAQQKDNQSVAGDGFVPLDAVQAFLLQLGIPHSIQRELLANLVRFDLIEPDIQIESDYGEWSFMRTTAFGLYTLESLCRRPCYIESIMIDTPLQDEKVRNEISRVYVEGIKPSLKNRLNSILFFMEHLHTIEVNEQARVASAGLGGVCPIMMPNIKNAVKQAVKAIRERAKVRSNND